MLEKMSKSRSERKDYRIKGSFPPRIIFLTKQKDSGEKYAWREETFIIVPETAQPFLFFFITSEI